MEKEYKKAIVLQSFIGFVERKEIYRYATKILFFADIGLRNVRLGFRQQEESHIMENIIYNELINRGYQVDVTMVSISEKNENENYVRKQLEVDFVCNLGYERIYMQSALNIDEVAKKEQQERSLIRIDDSFRKVIVGSNNIRKQKDEN